MFGFCATIMVVGLILLIVAMCCLTTDKGPFGLWMTLAIVALVMVICGSAFNKWLRESDQHELLSSYEEHIEDNEYSYCPYCGKELK